MINYLWLGLVLIAIAIGAGKEILGYKTTETPAPVILANVDEASFPLGTAEEVDGKTLYAYELKLEQGKSVTVPVTIEIPKTKYEVELAHQLAGDGTVDKDAIAISFPAQSPSGDVTIEMELQDKDGDKFLVSAGTLKAGSEELSSIGVSFADLVPTSENLLASVDFPVTIQNFTFRSKGETAPSKVLLGTPELKFAKVAYSGSEATSWMAILTESIPTYAKISIELALGLIGIMMFWLGLMRIAEAAGLVKVLANALKPIMVLLFPKVDPDSEAMGAILMNMAANMLGLGNAATPLGIKAMNELQKQNPYKKHASNAQCMLLALNTSSVTVLPATIIGYRAAAGSTRLMDFWLVMLIATSCATIAAVIACKLLERLPMFAIPVDAEKNDECQKKGDV